MRYQLIELPFPHKGSGVPRSGGIHLTDIIKFIEEENNKAFKDDGTWDSEMTMEAGFIWERALEMAYADRMAIRPDEIICDGIVCSPDGIGIDKDIYNPETEELLIQGTGKLTVEEYKFTWKSTVKKEGQLLIEVPPTDNWRYMTQVKSYCYAVGTDVVIMRIFHVNGDYRTRRPIPRFCRIWFTKEEIESNWAMILKYRDKMLTKLKGGAQ
ncbi:MAG: hypothetical protein EHM41_00190 [Chloroflexi bacterium]|nr:MAG: hypothetical protein EHM41_00190 [Chloroflexota bacterium]